MMPGPLQTWLLQRDLALGPVRLGVLASGEGSNLQAILDACARGSLPARVACVVCNVPEAGALEKAKRAGVPGLCLPHQGFPSREMYDQALLAELTWHQVEVVALAGFMRLVSPVLLREYPYRVLNIHPSLLPSFPGLHAVRQALEAGVRVTGCTVHLVDEGLDSGPILLQTAVPVLEGDDEATLQARVQVQEHRAYPRALELLVRGQIEVVQRAARRRVEIDGARPDGGAVLSSPVVQPWEERG